MNVHILIIKSANNIEIHVLPSLSPQPQSLFLEGNIVDRLVGIL